MRRRLGTLLALVALAGASGLAWAAEEGYGASAALPAIGSGKAVTVADMLRWAAEDEYLARGEYEAIIGAYGAMRPYTSIMAAELQHLAWLEAAFAERGLAFPADGSRGRTVVPPTLKAAAGTGVQAELDNIAMYDAFLARPELSRPENAAVRSLFESLKRASENHLRAFQNQLSKY